MIEWVDAKRQVRDHYVKLSMNTKQGYSLVWQSAGYENDVTIGIKFYSLPGETEMRVTHFLDMGSERLYQFNGLLTDVKLPNFLPATTLKLVLVSLKKKGNSKYYQQLTEILLEVKTVGSYLLHTSQDVTRVANIIEQQNFELHGSFYHIGHDNGQEAAYIKFDFSTDNMVENYTNGTPDATLIAYVKDPTTSESIFFSVRDIRRSDPSWKDAIQFDPTMESIIKHYDGKPDSLITLSTIYRKFKITQLLREME